MGAPPTAAVAPAPTAALTSPSIDVDGGFVDHRPTGHARVEARADLDRTHGGGEFGGELVGDARFGEESVGCGAGLGGVAHLGHHRPFDGGIEVGVVEDDERCVAAEFHHGLQDTVGASS